MNKSILYLISVFTTVILVVGGFWAANAAGLINIGRDDANNSSEKSNLTLNNDNSDKATVSLFFAKDPESSNDPTDLFLFKRTTDEESLAQFVVEQLIAGPNDEEADDGYYSNVKVRQNEPSTCEDKDVSVVVAEDTATVTFCRTFIAVGTIYDAIADQQIQQSLLALDGVNKVIILNKDGDCQFDESGENLCLPPENESNTSEKENESEKTLQSQGYSVNDEE